MVPRSDGFTPLDAVTLPAAMTGGQAPAQAPEQLDLFMASAFHRYTARPPSVRNVPPEPACDAITVAVAVPEEAGALECDPDACDPDGDAAALPPGVRNVPPEPACDAITVAVAVPEEAGALECDPDACDPDGDAAALPH